MKGQDKDMSVLDRRYDLDCEYELSLFAFGEGILCEKDLQDYHKPDTIFDEYRQENDCFPKEISLLFRDTLARGMEYGFTGVDPAFLVKLKTLKELILPDSIEQIDMTPELHRLLRANDTLIRGTFGSYAEIFANSYGVHFRPMDLVFAEHNLGRNADGEGTKLTLMFKRDGSVLIKEEIYSSVPSRGSVLNASNEYPLNKDFYESQTLEQITEPFAGREIHNEIISNGKLSDFISKAKEHKYYKGDN